MEKGRRPILMEQPREFDPAKDTLVDTEKITAALSRISRMKADPRFVGRQEEIAGTEQFLTLLSRRGFVGKESIGQINANYLEKLGFTPEEML